MLEILLFLLVVFPVLVGCALLLPLCGRARTLLIVFSGVLLAFASLALLAHGRFLYSPGPCFGFYAPDILFALHCVLLLAMLGASVWLPCAPLILLCLLNMLALGYFKYYAPELAEAGALFAGDALSLALVVAVSVVGSLIVLNALFLTTRRGATALSAQDPGRLFFFFLLVSLGAANGVLVCNSLTGVSLFWDALSLCSFALIAQDGSKAAKENARRALRLNLLGGLFLALGLYACSKYFGSVLLGDILARAAQATGQTHLTPLFLLCLAGFIRAGLPPFQSWLRAAAGAAGAPASALALLCSTSVGLTGAYLLLRLAPCYAGTDLAALISLFGAVSFLACAALALGQNDGQTIATYSAIGDLGLAIACAGLGTPGAIAAGATLLVVQAMAKALLIICLDDIEAATGLRVVRDMRGLGYALPLTASLTVVSVLTLFSPPFGASWARWMALEAAIFSPLTALLLVLGSLVTLAVWLRFACLFARTGRAETTPSLENRARLDLTPQVLLAGGAALSCLAAPLLYNFLAVAGGVVARCFGAISFPLPFLLLGAGILASFGLAARFPIRADDLGRRMATFFPEELLTRRLDVMALSILAVMFGVAL